MSEDLTLFFWSRSSFKHCNFGDYIGMVLAQSICGGELAWTRDERSVPPRLLTCGSILHFAKTGDTIWGTGVNGKHLKRSNYRFDQIDIRSVRGPLTRRFINTLGFPCPAVFGDPALLLPMFYHPRLTSISQREILIVHYSEKHLFEARDNVYSTDEHDWRTIVDAICSADLVVSSSLHGIIVAEAFGVPARLIRITENEPMFKYRDYYEGTNRTVFRVARSLDEAREMGGECSPQVDRRAIYQAFPFDRFRGISRLSWTDLEKQAGRSVE